MEQVKMGKKKQGREIPKFYATESAPSILSVITLDGIFAVNTHFCPEIGQFHCFNGICCLKERPAKTKYLFPVVVYRVKDVLHGKVDLNSDVEIQYLLLSEKDYDKMIKMNDSLETGTIEDYNLEISTKNETFQQLSISLSKEPFTNTPIKASWREDEKVRNHVLKYYDSIFKEKIGSSVGRFISESEYILLKQNKRGQEEYVNKPTSSIPKPPVDEEPSPMEEPPINYEEFIDLEDVSEGDMF